MMNQNNNRLDFNSIVNKQMSQGDKQSYFSTFVVTRPEEIRFQPVPKRGADITSSLNSIISQVHKSLKPKVYRTAPQVKETQMSTTETKTKKKLKPILKNSRACLTKKFGPSVNLNTVSRIPLSQLKADLQQRNQQRLRRGIGSTHDLNTFAKQQRLREVLRQKCLLEDMLVQHKKLQTDRNSIAVELHSMRNYLNDIRSRLDNSLNRLNKKKTISSGIPKPLPPLPPSISQQMLKDPQMMYRATINAMEAQQRFDHQWKKKNLKKQLQVELKAKNKKKLKGAAVMQARNSSAKNESNSKNNIQTMSKTNNQSKSDSAFISHNSSKKSLSKDTSQFKKASSKNELIPKTTSQSKSITPSRNERLSKNTSQSKNVSALINNFEKKFEYKSRYDYYPKNQTLAEKAPNNKSRGAIQKIKSTDQQVDKESKLTAQEKLMAPILRASNE